MVALELILGEATSHAGAPRALFKPAIILLPSEIFVLGAPWRMSGLFPVPSVEP